MPAEKEIWDIHVNPLLKPWEVLQKLRMYRNLIDDGEDNVNEAAGKYGLGSGNLKMNWRNCISLKQSQSIIRA